MARRVSSAVGNPEAMVCCVVTRGINQRDDGAKLGLWPMAALMSWRNAGYFLSAGMASLRRGVA